MSEPEEGGGGSGGGGGGGGGGGEDAESKLTLKCQTNAVGVEVLDYCMSVEGDVSNYFDHNFTLRINVGQHMYLITRSYAAFCIFDAHLRKKYPRSVLPVLPLTGKNLFANVTRRSSKQLVHAKQVLEDGIKNTVGDLRASLSGNLSSMGGGGGSTGGSGGVKSMKRVDMTEAIHHKKQPLNTYMKELLEVSEVTQGDLLLNFLDERESGHAVDGDADAQEDRLSSIDLLLADEPVVKRTVLRQHTVPLFMRDNQVACWRFSTQSHDIGFRVVFNEQDVFPYQRIDSHLKAETGVFELPSGHTGTITLMFDNTYSKFRSKALCYSVRVCDKIEFQIAKDTVVYKAKERHTLGQQRVILQRALNASSTSAFPVANSVSLEGGAIIEEVRFRTASTWEEELVRIKDEKKTLKYSLDDALRVLEEERSASAEKNLKYDEMALGRTAAEEDLAAARLEIGRLKQIISEEQQRARQDLALGVIAQERQASEYTELQAQFAVLEEQLQEQAEEAVKSKEQIAKLKAEKKQLKMFSLQAKADIETLTHDKQLLILEAERMREALRASQEKLMVAIDNKAFESEEKRRPSFEVPVLMQQSNISSSSSESSSSVGSFMKKGNWGASFLGGVGGTATTAATPPPTPPTPSFLLSEDFGF